MRQRRLMNQINVVPYIDVMLVLLIIFMVTASAQTGSIDIPTTGALPAPSTEAMIIELKGDSSLSLRKNANSDTIPLQANELEQVIRDAISKNADQPFLVAADKNLPYEKIITLLDQARQLGVKKISLQTQPTK